MRNLLSKIFTFIGVLLLFFSVYLYWQRTNPNRLSFEFNNVDAKEMIETKSVEATESMIKANPIGIRIRSISVELPVVYSRMTNDLWETTDEGVSFLDTSTIPGNTGNSIMYGHNWNNILGNLGKVAPGQKIEILYDDGVIRDFTIEYVQEISPLSSDILAKTDDRRLTLYTCSGFLDSKRLVVTAFYSAN